MISRGKAADPVDVGLLGADAVTLDPQMPADAVEKLAWW